jgi:aconitate hydratase
VKVCRVDGTIDAFNATAAVQTQLETELLRHGGVIPYILHKTIAGQGKA